MIYMPGGRSLVNNSIFNLVLMLAGFSPTSSSSFPPSSGLFTFSCFRLLPVQFLLSFSLIYFLSFFLSSVLIPSRRRLDKDEISTARANKFLHRPLNRVPISTSASRNQKRRNSKKGKRNEYFTFNGNFIVTREKTRVTVFALRARQRDSTDIQGQNASELSGRGWDTN